VEKSDPERSANISSTFRAWSVELATSVFAAAGAGAPGGSPGVLRPEEVTWKVFKHLGQTSRVLSLAFEMRPVAPHAGHLVSII
jgi:hypothetical protein